jgi:hypothetical protein
MPRPGHTGRRLEDFDPNASDPNDSDFSAGAASSPRPRRPATSSHKRKSQAHRTPQKKRARRRYGSDSDIVDDEDDIEEEEFTESSEEEAPVDLNPRTGRAVRSAAKERKNYEESDDDGEEATFVEETGESEQDGEEDEVKISPKKTRTGIRHAAVKLEKPASQIVRLRFTNWAGLSSSSRPQSLAPQVKDEIIMTRTRNTRSRTASRPPTSAAAAAAMGTRKSSRLSREPEPMVALSSSGRHAIPASSADDIEDDDDEETVAPRRRAVGSKGPRATAVAKKMPSTVMEQSQEGTQAEEAEVQAEEEPELPPHDVVDSVELHVEAAEVVEEVEAAEPMETEDAPAIEVVAGAEDEFKAPESDDSDGPVGRRRTLRVRPHAYRVPIMC